MSTLTRNSKTAHAQIPAQEIIKNPNIALKFGLLRKKQGKLNIGKWPFRFIVVTSDSLIVYTEETSPSPKSTTSLARFNEVKTAESKNNEWCFVLKGPPLGNTDVPFTKTFACINEKERNEWMRVIRLQVESLQSLSKGKKNLDEEDDAGDNVYDEVDELIDENIQTHQSSEDPSRAKSRKNSYTQLPTRLHDESSSKPETQNETSSKSANSLLQKTKQLGTSVKALAISLNSSLMTSLTPKSPATSSPTSPKIIDISATSLSIDLSATSPSSSPAPVLPARRPTAPPESPTAPPGSPVPPPKPPIPRTISTDSVPSNTTTDPAPSETAPPLPAPRILPRCPPDYIDVTSSGCHGNQEGELYVPYEFPPPRPEILESLCFIQDPIPDREKCLHQLECTLTPGAYLVRNSRQSNLKILAYLSSDGTVREYKVLEQDARFTLDMEAFFTSIGELLANYTQTTIPGTNDLLKQGIHEFV